MRGGGGGAVFFLSHTGTVASAGAGDGAVVLPDFWGWHNHQLFAEARGAGKTELRAHLVDVLRGAGLTRDDDAGTDLSRGCDPTESDTID